MDFLRRPRLESSFGILCRLSDRPRFNTPCLRHTDTKSHGVWLEAYRHQLEDIPPSDLHHTLGSRYKALFQRVTPYCCRYTCHCLSCYSCHFFPCFLCSCPCGSCLCCLFLCLHKRCHHRSAQPASLNGHQGQESQSLARNHVLVAPDSRCHEPPCPCKDVYARVQSVGSLTSHGGSSQILLPSRFPRQLPLLGWILLPSGRRVVPIVVLVGTNAPGTPPRRNQSWSNQLRLIILGSCDQGFNLKSTVIQTLRGQTVETGIPQKIVIIFWHFLMRTRLQSAPLPVWHDHCNWARYNTSISNDSEMKVLTKSKCGFCVI